MDFIKDYVGSFLKTWESWKITNFAHDPGGFTAFGISRIYHPNAKIFKLIDSGEKDQTKLLAAASEFYQDWFNSVKNNNLQLLPEILHIPYFDFTVNAGEDDAIACWQRTINYFVKDKVKVDGGFGKGTKAASQIVISLADKKDLFHVYQQNRLSIYIEKTVKDPRKIETLNGWKNRVNDLTRRVLEVT